MKFGGAVLRNPDGFLAMANILKSESKVPIMAVASAFSSSTRTLERAARLAENGQQELALATAKSVVEDHARLAEVLLGVEATRSALAHMVGEGAAAIHNLLRGISITRELTARTLDAVLSYGEFFALHIVKHYLLEQNIPAVALDSRSLIVTDSAFTAATPLLEPTRRRIETVARPLLAAGAVVLTQGFVGADIRGETTTMGKESSNLTATLLGEMLGSDEIVVWTDVPGIQTADPKITVNTRLIPAMSYDDAALAAHSGLKLLYPTMIDPLRRSNSTLSIRSAFEPDELGTRIAGGETTPPPALLSMRRLERPHDNRFVSVPKSRIVAMNCSAAQMFRALQQYDNEQFRQSDFAIELGTTPNVQSLEVQETLAPDLIRFLHKQLFELS